MVEKRTPVKAPRKGSELEGTLQAYQTGERPIKGVLGLYEVDDEVLQWAVVQAERPSRADESDLSRISPTHIPQAHSLRHIPRRTQWRRSRT